MATKTRSTGDDVLRLSEQGERYELIGGELIPMVPTSLEKANVELRVGLVFDNYVSSRRLGKVFVGEPLFLLDEPGGLARAPDVAFVRLERLLAQESLAGAFRGAPDLAVEIVSPSNTADAIQQKVQDWLAHGTSAVLVMYPPSRNVVLWGANGAVIRNADDELDLNSAIP
ncbi:MAG TPA: Uma2 family endonuclease, partial [Chloroflexota bacterium]|nr:Uma2 family endonuclease [Chloroflexota bacterium]